MMFILAGSFGQQSVWLSFLEEVGSPYTLSSFSPIERYVGAGYLSWWFKGASFEVSASSDLSLLYRKASGASFVAGLCYVDIGSIETYDENGNKTGSIRPYFAGVRLFGFKKRLLLLTSDYNFGAGMGVSLGLANFGESLFCFGLDGILKIQRVFENIGRFFSYVVFRNLMSDWAGLGFYIGYGTFFKANLKLEGAVGGFWRIYPDFLTPECSVSLSFPLSVVKGVPSFVGFDGAIRFMPGEDFPLEMRSLIFFTVYSTKIGFKLGLAGSTGIFYGVKLGYRF